jgi:transcription antitermination factor NusG
MAKLCPKSAVMVSHEGVADLPDAKTSFGIPKWLALYTFPKHERAVAERLTSLSAEVFYPSLLRESQWKDRKTWIRRPLFPGYVFVRVPLENRITILGVPGVIRIISCRGIPLAIPDSEIEAVRLCLVGGCNVEPHPYVESGMRVRLSSGPCAGLEGVASNSSNGCKLIVSVGAIRQAAAIDVSSGDLETVDPANVQFSVC